MPVEIISDPSLPFYSKVMNNILYTVMTVRLLKCILIGLCTAYQGLKERVQIRYPV